MTVHVSAYLCAKGAAEALEFYKAAFGATERYRWVDKSGKIGHAEFMVGDTLLMISDEWEQYRVLSPKTLGGHAVSFVLEVPDADAAFRRALDAGAKVERPVTDAPYGRGGWVVDPFGHRWHVMTPNPSFKPADLG